MSEMRRRPRLLMVSAAVAAAGLLAACGDSATGGGGEETAAAAGGAAKSEVAKVGGVDEQQTMEEVCGTKKITVALADGFGGNSWRRIARAEFEDEAKRCKNIEKVLYADGQNDPQKSISDVKALTAQGVDALVVFPDSGKAMLPAIKEAYRAGVQVVPYTSNPGGTPGEDYVDFVTPNFKNDGRTWGEWMAEQLGGKGNVIFLGGTPGNEQSPAELEGIQEAFAKYPDIKLLEGGPVDTNWDPAQTQKVMAGLLTKHKQIDGIISDYGGGSVGAIRAFVQANRPLVPWAANDANEFACMYEKYKDSNPKFEVMTVSSRNWLSRLALRKAVAAAQGVTSTEPAILNIPPVEDSTGAVVEQKPKCDGSLPPDAILSSQLPPDDLKAIFEG